MVQSPGWVIGAVRQKKCMKTSGMCCEPPATPAQAVKETTGCSTSSPGASTVPRCAAPYQGITPLYTGGDPRLCVQSWGRNRGYRRSGLM
jgi:hypothetical protein